MSIPPSTSNVPWRGLVRMAIVLAGAAVGIVLIASSVAPQFVDEPEASPVGRELLPDLVSAPIIELSAGRAPDGREVLFFSAEIANLGEGDLLIRAIRADPGASFWRIRQRIEHETSGFSRIDVPARLEFAGDTHDHWHVYRAAGYQLFSAGTEVAVDQKVGFCFFDNLHYQPTLSGSPSTPVFDKDVCDGRRVTSFTSGLSVGWSDRYIWTLPGQSLDITNLEPGPYLLEMTADPEGWFREANTDNNKSWVEIRLGRSADNLPTVTVLSSGPAN